MHTTRSLSLATLPILAFALGIRDARAGDADEKFLPLFNGKNLTGWVNVNCAPETWTVRDGAICCTGIPTGALRTERQYENFILEAEWRHLKSGGNSGIFIWGSPIAAPGVPFLRGIEVQVLDHGYNAKGKNEWYTTHGDVFPIHGATMKPLRPPPKGGQRSFPSEERSKPSPEWNHYRIECNNGSLRLSVNGKEVSGGDECNYRKGYLALESEGAPVEFKNIRIRELPATNTPPELSAPLDQGWRPLYNGVDLRGWKEPAAAGRWKAAGTTLTQLKADADAGKRADLETAVEFGDKEFSFDFKLKAALPEGAPAGVTLRGLAVTFSEAGLKPGQWGRFRVHVNGRAVTVFLNDKELRKLELPETAPAKGPLGLIDCGGTAADWTNLYVRKL